MYGRSGEHVKVERGSTSTFYARRVRTHVKIYATGLADWQPTVVFKTPKVKGTWFLRVTQWDSGRTRTLFGTEENVFIAGLSSSILDNVKLF